mmetsp:Transcript_12/g.63  ORF Transcript_12/g.63 Transcript_12/m.63 type:complete len:532 (-) Transcript_12:61-1656(-)
MVNMTTLETTTTTSSKVDCDQEEPVTTTHQVSNDEEQRPSCRMVFSSTIIQTLNGDPRYRLPTTYAGVRRVRPSSRQVQKVLWNQKNHPSTTKPKTPKPAICYKVVDPTTGQERRMTKEEKRKAKRERKLLHEQQNKEAAKAQEEKLQQEQTKETQNQEEDSGLIDNDNKNSHQNNEIVQLKINPLTLEQELADLQGERNGAVPPALLSPSQSFAAWNKLEKSEQQRTDTSNNTGITRREESKLVVMDEAWSQQWANVLRQSMLPAMETRKAEDMRAMAYDVVPQAWTRMRPESTQVVNLIPTDNKTPEEAKPPRSEETNASSTETDHEQESQQQEEDKGEAKSSKQADPSSSSNNSSNTKTYPPVTGTELRVHSLEFPIRSTTTTVDQQLNVVVQFLNASCGQELYLSCGAKFGCDLLLYDGPRSERHAFAGLRVVVASPNKVLGGTASSSSLFPLPRAYDLAGYVRCLNTAGKLALLATVVPPKNDNESPRVAFLDLLLQRIRVDPPSFKKRKRPPKTIEHRLQTLAKK